MDNVTKTTKIASGPFRILSAQLIGYPISALYSFLFPFKPPKRDGDGKVIPPNDTFWRELFTVGFGMGLALYYCKLDVAQFAHSLGGTVVTWAVLKIGTKIGVKRSILAACVWILQSVHLGWAYAVASLKTSTSYDSNFLTPQCVLYLKLISLAMDYMEQGIAELPSLFATLGYVYFWGGFLVGPQFRYQRYRKWITGELFEQEELAEQVESQETKALELAKSRSFRRSAWPYALQCFGLGAVYLALYQGGNMAGLHFSQVASPDFPNRYPDMWKRIAFIGKVSVSKFLGTWKLTEGVVALAGLGYDGRKKQGDESPTVADWSALRNVEPLVFETPYSLQDYISAFNINTNLWTREYIYMRLRPVVGHRQIALGASM
ncbi:hypothetical protein HDU93_000792 [Gonapodya sp. JEL0774]|nr:hypothetical protein HDU93_000792 [Gonapodya sp. JEL0774]